MPTSDTHTLACRHDNFSDWHRGRRRYAVWAAPAGTPAIAAAVAGLQARLAPWLLPGYARQPHITVALGGFPVHRRMFADDYGPDSLAAQGRALAAAPTGPFTLTLQHCAAFTSAPYLAVDGDTATLRRLRQALVGAHGEKGAGSYTPHLTLGLFGGRHPLSAVHAQLRELALDAPLSLEVSHLELLAYETSVIGGPLEPMARFDLERGCLEILPEAGERFFERR